MRIVAVVNERARRGGPQVRRTFERALLGRLPSASRNVSEVVLTRSLDDLERLAKSIAEDAPDLVISAGGDGSAIGVLNAVRRAQRAQGHATAPLVPLAVVKLGTGNGWANAVGAPDVERSLDLIVNRVGARQALPLRRFDLLEIEGQLTHFGGTGWDAELIDDFQSQKTGPGVLPPRLRRGLAGYLNALLTRTVPRNLESSQIEVEIKNTGAPALGIDARGIPFEIPSTQPGGEAELLYRGPVNVCGVGTSNQWGFGFKAFPFAGLVPGRFNLRMFVGTTVQALSVVPLLWTGKHPLDKMLTWLLTQCDATFSRQVPFQIGGDLLGHRDRIRYGLAPEQVQVLDFERLTEAHKRPAHALLELGRGVVQGSLAPALGVSLR